MGLIPDWLKTAPGPKHGRQTSFVTTWTIVQGGHYHGTNASKDVGGQKLPVNKPYYPI